MQNQRVLPIEDGNNFRDLGGYQTINGQSIKWHRLLRSGHLHTLNQDDLTVLSQLNVKYDIDFRAPDEIEKQPDKVPATATYSPLPVFDRDETDASKSSAQLAAELNGPKAGYDHMLEVYKNMVTTKQAKSSYQTFFDKLLSVNETESVLFHCTAGKDRTGMGAVFLLSALQVDQHTIVDDYLLTNDVTREYVTQKIDRLKQQQNVSKTLTENILALSTVSPDYVNTALTLIKHEYGTVLNYLQKYIGITDRQLSDLRQLYLD